MCGRRYMMYFLEGHHRKPSIAAFLALHLKLVLNFNKQARLADSQASIDRPLSLKSQQPWVYKLCNTPTSFLPSIWVLGTFDSTHKCFSDQAIFQPSFSPFKSPTIFSQSLLMPCAWDSRLIFLYSCQAIFIGFLCHLRVGEIKCHNFLDERVSTTASRGKSK